MVFTYLAEELQPGDVAGAVVYADWRANLLTWEQRQPLLEKFCAGIGLPNTAAGFTERLRGAHLACTQPPNWTPGTPTTPTW
ncbi:hypothetical protein AB0K41_43500 [Actinomadura coerulea]